MKLKKRNSIGLEELDAVKRVVSSGNLSQYVGSWCDDFMGGPEVNRLEQYVKEYYQVDYCLAVNSWTSGLICAVGALDVNPGDEIIVTPWTMSATVMAIIHWNCIPIFADISIEDFNLDVTSVERLITSRTKAIMVADIFGQGHNNEELRILADKHDLKIISDSAQTPYSLQNDTIAGTMSDIGGFSLNYHKHIHCGEGGLIVTNDKNLYERMALIRNHGENAVTGMGRSDLNNMIGFNFRLGEIEAAIAVEQFKKLKNIASTITTLGDYMLEKFKDIRGITPVFPKENCKHNYYILPLLYSDSETGIKRKDLIRAIEANGVYGFMNGYVLVYDLPMFKTKTAYGVSGFPWSITESGRRMKYERGICPVAEELQDSKFLGFEMCLWELTKGDIDDIYNVLVSILGND